MGGLEQDAQVGVDLNADLGEECGDDAAMLRLVSSANIAAGGHAGGGEVLARTVRWAHALGVAIGAHPSYPDRAGFGRRSLASELAADDLARLVAEQVAEQVAEVERAARTAGGLMVQVKAHGALYGDAATREPIAGAFVRGVVRAVPDRRIAVLGPPGCALAIAADSAGLAFVAEGFADRRYAPDGSLAPRTAPGAVLVDADEVGRQAVALASGAEVTASDGSALRLRVQSVCVHGDTPGAVGLARNVREVLEAAGIRIQAASDPGREWSR